MCDIDMNRNVMLPSINLENKGDASDINPTSYGICKLRFATGDLTSSPFGSLQFRSSRTKNTSGNDQHTYIKLHRDNFMLTCRTRPKNVLSRQSQQSPRTAEV